MNEITINDLLRACALQVKKGNGNKKIILSSDEEGNGGHVMYYLFTEKVSDALLYAPIEESEEKDYVVLG